MKQVDGYYRLAQLKDRGWTATMIKRFLPTHDKEGGGGMWNSRLGRTAGVLLYAIHRVEAIEATSEFQAAKLKAERRR